MKKVTVIKQNDILIIKQTGNKLDYRIAFYKAIEEAILDGYRLPIAPNNWTAPRGTLRTGNGAVTMYPEGKDPALVVAANLELEKKKGEAHEEANLEAETKEAARLAAVIKAAEDAALVLDLPVGDVPKDEPLPEVKPVAKEEDTVAYSTKPKAKPKKPKK